MSLLVWGYSIPITPVSWFVPTLNSFVALVSASVAYLTGTIGMVSAADIKPVQTDSLKKIGIRGDWVTVENTVMMRRLRYHSVRTAPI